MMDERPGKIERILKIFDINSILTFKCYNKMNEYTVNNKKLNIIEIYNGFYRKRLKTR